MLLVLRTDEALNAFCATAHVGVGGAASASLGPVGRCAQAGLSLGSGGGGAVVGYRWAPAWAALAVLYCHMLVTHSPRTPSNPPPPRATHSCSRGAFVGVSIEGSLFVVRDAANLSFYGENQLIVCAVDEALGAFCGWVVGTNALLK